jgi:hypothetical protein
VGGSLPGHGHYVQSVRMTRAARVGVTFIAPGTQTNSIPLGTAVAVGKDWLVKVTSATLNANDQMLAARDEDGYPLNSPPPPGAQYAMTSVSVTYRGGGSASMYDFEDSIETVGSHNAVYRNRGGCPRPGLTDHGGSIYAGQSAAGNVCFLIASNDADSLVLTASDYPAKLWFALR